MILTLKSRHRSSLHLSRAGDERRSLTTSRGASAQAIAIDRAAPEYRYFGLDRPPGMGRQFFALFESLLKFRSLAVRRGWDGYEALPLDDNSLYFATRFLMLLGTDELPTRASVDADGEVALDWDLGPRRMLSISVGSSGQLSYAAVLDGGERYGSLAFSDSIPDELVRLIHVTAGVAR